MWTCGVDEMVFLLEEVIEKIYTILELFIYITQKSINNNFCFKDAKT